MKPIGGVVDTVLDQHGAPWIKHAAALGQVWLRRSDFVTKSSETFGALARIGASCITPGSRNKLASAVEAHTAFREALVAAHPGWLGDHYVFGDGRVAAPPTDTREVIVAFKGDRKFAPKGDARLWREGVEGLVKGQSLPIFVLAYAFVGPLMRFAPPGVANSIVEIVGGRESGKTTLGVLAASVWAGDEDADCGGGETWQTTLHRLDPTRLTHRDGLLLLDEGNLAGSSDRDRAEMIKSAIFKLAGTGSRRRMGDDDGPQVSLAALSTTNTPLEELVSGSADTIGALHSRLITLRVEPDRAHGVLSHVPEGCKSSRNAIERLRAAANASWGGPGRQFIGKLVAEAARDEAALRRKIARSLEKHIAAGVGASSSSARVQKSLALVVVAGRLAKRYGALPKSWNVIAAVLAVEREFTKEEVKPLTPVEQIAVYAKKNRADIQAVDQLSGPLSRKRFETAAGFSMKRHDRRELLIPAARFKQAFPDHLRLAKELAKVGRLRMENGKSPKHTIKTPTAVCGAGRVYAITLDAT